MTVSRESGRGLAAVSRARVPWKEPLQDTTRLCRVRKPSSSHTTINDFAKLGTALDGTPTIVGRLSQRIERFERWVGKMISGF